MLPIPTHIRFANFKSLSEDIKGKKLFKLGNYVFVQFIGACKVPRLGLTQMWMVLFTSLLGTTHLDREPTELSEGFLLWALVVTPQNWIKVCFFRFVTFWVWGYYFFLLSGWFFGGFVSLPVGLEFFKIETEPISRCFGAQMDCLFPM